MIDYGYQFNCHCVDREMHLWMRANPCPPHMPASEEQIEYERGWANYQNQLYYGWMKQ